MMEWRAVDLIVRKPQQVDGLQLAADLHWIEVSPGLHSVRLTAEGRRIVMARRSAAKVVVKRC